MAPTVKVDQNKIYKLIAELINVLQPHYPELSLRLHLQAVQSINMLQSVTELEDQAYEFISQAFIIFEEEITETDAKV